ncbi:hypothetical protein [Nafulsella turpanensis]|uniref:hypothetical protein n=1 Tax=Nafulsella turpanensis TaxID=1265690 RepID=UPI0012680AE8|nr:hypothetical protein [Nafulsella turpanensis]
MYSFLFLKGGRHAEILTSGLFIFFNFNPFYSEKINYFFTALLAAASVLISCEKADEPDPGLPKAEQEQAFSSLSDAVTGVSLPLRDDWQVKKDPVLFEQKYGFLLYRNQETQEQEASGHTEEPVAHIGLVYKAEPQEMDALVEEKMKQYSELKPVKTVITLGNGCKGIVLSGLPGTREYSVAAFSGYVEWAAWGTDGFASLGRYVVVRNGKYRSLTAHLPGQ